jgi:hypothetical protein
MQKSVFIIKNNVLDCSRRKNIFLDFSQMSLGKFRMLKWPTFFNVEIQNEQWRTYFCSCFWLRLHVPFHDSSGKKIKERLCKITIEMRKEGK